MLWVKLLFENNQCYTFLFLKPRCQNKMYTIQLIRHAVAQILTDTKYITPTQEKGRQYETNQSNHQPANYMTFRLSCDLNAACSQVIIAASGVSVWRSRPQQCASVAVFLWVWRLTLTITAGAFTESYEGKHLSIQVHLNNLNLDNKKPLLISWNQFPRRCFGPSLQRRFGSPVHLEFKWCIRDRSPCGVCEVSWWKQPGREAFQLAWFMRDLAELVMRGAEDSQRSVQRTIYVLTE